MGVKISALPAIVTPALTDIFPIVQSGVTYKETFTQLSSLFATAGANSNITSMTGLTGVLRAPTAIQDSNGVNIFSLVGNASAVNYLTVINNVTAAAPRILASGSDTDIRLSLASKGNLPVALIGGNTTAGIEIYNGTTSQHQTNFNFSNTSATRDVVFPDSNGTVYLSNKANGIEAANAVTASGTSGIITTSSLTTASGSSYAITWTNTFITTSSIIILSLMGGTNTKDTIQIEATAGSGTSTLTITNNNAASLDGTVLIGYIVIP